MLQEEEGTNCIDLEGGEGFSMVDLGEGLFGMKDARDAKGDAEVAR